MFDNIVELKQTGKCIVHIHIHIYANNIYVNMLQYIHTE